MSSTTELVRPEYGTPGQRNRVSEIKDGPHTRKVVRDRYGRITGVEGRSRVDDLVDAAEDLTERVGGLELDALLDDDNLTREQLDEALAALPKGATREEVEAALSELRTLALAANGKVTVGGLLVDERAVADIARRFGLRCRLSVKWMTPSRADELGTDGYFNYTPEGGHVLYVRLGMNAKRTSYVIAHECGHASQLERLREDFLDIYQEHRDELEAEARQMAESVADIPIAVALS